MSNFLKLTVLLFFTCVLSLSISKDTFEKEVRTNTQDQQEEDAGFYLSGKTHHKAFGLHQLTEVVVNAVNHLPAPQKKKFPNDSLGSSFSYEACVQDPALIHLYPFEEIASGLSVSDIIFPFHYFW